jgi:hypothetical protein
VRTFRGLAASEFGEEGRYSKGVDRGVKIKERKKTYKNK